jgi:hypothetical protein
MELRVFLIRSINSIKKEDRKGAFCSLDKKSILDLRNSIPPTLESEVKDLLSFSIPNILPSISITTPFSME